MGGYRNTHEDFTMKTFAKISALLTVLVLSFASTSALADVTTQAYPGWDAAGNDFDSFQSGNAANCSQTCIEKGNCVGAEFVNSTGRCWLKHRIGAYTRLAGATLFLKILTGRSGIDYPGGDYHSYATDSWQNCSRACYGQARCKAYTFVTQTNTCWLKDRIVDANFLTGAVSGRK